MSKQDDPIRQNENSDAQRAANRLVENLGGTSRVKQVEGQLETRQTKTPAANLELTSNGRNRRSLGDAQPKDSGVSGPQRKPGQNRP
jgi:hypothetical protein